MFESKNVPEKRSAILDRVRNRLKLKAPKVASMTASPNRSQTSESVGTKELNMVERFNKERGINMLVTSEVVIQK